MSATNSLRVPFLLIALLIMLLVVGIEGFYGAYAPYLSALSSMYGRLQQPGIQASEPPGMGISSLALMDGLFLFSIVLIVSPLVISHARHAQVQGVATLIVAILVLLGCLKVIFLALAKLVLMVSLLLAFPFGTIAYLFVYASFDRPTAVVMLSGLFAAKVAAGVCLVAAHQGFLKNVGLVLIFLSMLVSHIVVGFLHGIVPRLLVSITDALAAIVVPIIAIVWAIVLLIGAIIAILKLIATLKNVLDSVLRMALSVVPGWLRPRPMSRRMLLALVAVAVLLYMGSLSIGIRQSDSSDSAVSEEHLNQIVKTRFQWIETFGSRLTRKAGPDQVRCEPAEILQREHAMLVFHKVGPSACTLTAVLKENKTRQLILTLSGRDGRVEVSFRIQNQTKTKTLSPTDGERSVTLALRSGDVVDVKVLKFGAEDRVQVRMGARD